MIPIPPQLRKVLLIATLLTSITVQARGQGTFENLDFESGVFVPAPTTANPFGVDWAQAMPGWTGFLGMNQQSVISHNALSLSVANITIQGPDYPSPNLFHGQYYVVLQPGLDPSDPTGTRRLTTAITQLGTIPSTAQSIQFYLAFGAMGVSFDGHQIPLSILANSPMGYSIIGGDVSAFAGQTGELRFQGGGFLDFIQFSEMVIPEPSTFCLFGLGAVLFGWRFLCKRP